MKNKMFKKLILLIMLTTQASAGDIAIGTISYSKHFSSKVENPNESHAGMYVKYNSWAAGWFDNSYDDKSQFIAREFKIGKHWSTSLGIANGYEQDINSDHGYLPLMFLTYHVSVVRINLTSDAVVFGVEF